MTTTPTSSEFPASPETFDLDMSSEAFVRAPAETYAYLRDRAPAYYWPRHQAWMMTRYDDVDALLRDPRFSTDRRKWRYAHTLPHASSPELAALFENDLFTMHADDHRRVRKLVAPAFSPRSIARLEDEVRALVNSLLDDAKIDQRETFDVSQELAEPLPIRVISTMLDIPAEKDEDFRVWGTSVIRLALPYLPREVLMEAAEKATAGVSMVRAIIAERRQNPGEDILSKLISAQEEGERLSEDELMSLVAGLLVAGSETTVHLITFATYQFLTHEDSRRRLQDDPSLLGNALEESLRHDNFGKSGVTRYALEDVELHGKTIEKGDMVILNLASALLDERVWPDAERFDVTRDPVSNITFGRGAHFCLGAHLARLEGRVAMQTLLERFPEMQLAGPPSFDYAHPFIRRIDKLEVRLRA
ncbi:cytochrome P450 [Haliangium ochraceum]|uniref:Cytochrome P450 n=1 Tax=Haliangium ochraceum (strain DSM 14365 / JCM 11303 / SMP-2) TaxID=502025 RepID=D0LGV5_HALO1|nr:cytochrome P450 [Haliangium ochraceum]ACY14677.1 cytochrome P450 [Haliangium ochraceum DSM 14365]